MTDTMTDTHAAAVLARGWFHRRGPGDDYDVHDEASGAGKGCPGCVPCVIVRADAAPAEAQPVGEVFNTHPMMGSGYMHFFLNKERLPTGTKLYTTPPSAPDGAVHDALQRDIDARGVAEIRQAELDALTRSAPSAPVGVGAQEHAETLARQLRWSTTSKRMRAALEAGIASLRALAQQPAACTHSWHDYGTVNRAWCERCNAVAVIGHEDRPYGVLSVTDDGEYRADPIQQPAAAGEEIMVNAAHDVYTLPLHPSGLSSGPRFVVHVPAPEQPAAVECPHRTRCDCLGACKYGYAGNGAITQQGGATDA